MPAPTTQSELCLTTLLTSGSPAPLSCSLLKASPPQGAPISVATPRPYCTNQNPGGGFLDSFLSLKLFLSLSPCPDPAPGDSILTHSFACQHYAGPCHHHLDWYRTGRSHAHWLPPNSFLRLKPVTFTRHTCCSFAENPAVAAWCFQDKDQINALAGALHHLGLVTFLPGLRPPCLTLSSSLAGLTLRTSAHAIPSLNALPCSASSPNCCLSILQTAAQAQHFQRVCPGPWTGFNAFATSPG